MIRRAATVAMIAVVQYAPGAAAQAFKCAIPRAMPELRPDGPTPRESRRVLPIGGYTLAITWAPQFCHDKGRDPDARFQCGEGNRFGFTLHGLWPDGRGKTWPQYCAPAPLLRDDVVRANLCATPSAQLLQHEYAKHGTCMAIPPRDYFARSTAMYSRLRYPDMDALSRRRDLTAGRFAAAFARANPGLTPAMMRVTATRRGWLDEVWLCHDTRFRPVVCPAHQGGMKPATRLKIWRGVR